MSGILYLVATPIGNLEDITYRAIQVLQQVDMIAAEDTRHTKKLLNHYEIHKPIISYHEHNKKEKGLRLLEMLQEGKNLALVTDAGTPGISDPGEDLVRLCHEHAVSVTSTPGPVALITALILSGLPTRRFVFEGFLPHDKKERKDVLEMLPNEHRTVIFYEAPHRLKQTLKRLHEYLGNRKIAITRELTKRYEEVITLTLEEAMEKYETQDPRGEYVLIVQGKSIEEIHEEHRREWEQLTIDEHMDHYMSRGSSKKEAMKLVAKDRGKSKRDIYQQLLEHE